MSAAIGVLLLSSPALAQVGCLSQAETVDAVRDGRVLAYDEAVPRRLRNAGEFLGVRLCADNGILVYVVSTLTDSGRVTHTAVDAKSGRIVGKR
ncbi:PepSY domain-containing protein [Agaricicola taiwanensis]|nr:hypothetical protein [Agaricicola taiwanensis]